VGDQQDCGWVRAPASQQNLPAAFNHCRVGFHPSLEARSAFSVALVLSHAVVSKEDYLQGWGVDASWSVSGSPQRLHLDNAKEFHSQALARGTARYGIEIQYRPPAAPHSGGHIERLIDTMMSTLRILPGATGPNVAERSHGPEATAMMTMDELETWLAHQIAGGYHHTVHRSLGKAPIAAWKEAIASLAVLHRYPSDEDRLPLLKGLQRLPTLPPAGKEVFLHRAMVVLQDLLIGHTVRGPIPQHGLTAERKAIVVLDLVWALTRADCHRPDCLVYQTIPLAFLGGACRHVECRDARPVDFSRPYMDERHLLLAIITVWTGRSRSPLL
jgi:hypothetical protein